MPDKSHYEVQTHIGNDDVNKSLNYYCSHPKYCLDVITAISGDFFFLVELLSNDRCSFNECFVRNTKIT